MHKRFGWLLCLALAAWAAPLHAGDKTIDVGKGKEIKGEIKGDEPKVRLEGAPLEMSAKLYVIKMDADKSYRIAMDSVGDKFDPFLIVQDQGGKQLAFDDDGGGGDKLNSALAFVPGKSGNFKVYAAALSGTGEFVLRVEVGPGPKELKVGKEPLREAGRLDGKNKVAYYSVKLKAGEEIQIDLKSDDFDAFLAVQSAEGKILMENDDFEKGGRLDSRIVFRAPEGGVYRILATSLGMLDTGNYVLEVRRP